MSLHKSHNALQINDDSHNLKYKAALKRYMGLYQFCYLYWTCLDEEYEIREGQEIQTRMPNFWSETYEKYRNCMVQGLPNGVEATKV